MSSAGCEICEPTRLYNILVQCSKSPAVLDETYLALFDARDASEYTEAHIVLAKGVKNDEKGERKIPFGVHLPSLMYCVVYDGNTVSIVEDTPAVQYANKIAASGSKNPVLVLKGGFERFSAEYPFLRTQKIMYTPMELMKLPRYPSEIVPLFLYLGERCHAYNAAMNYDLKIHAHVSLGHGLEAAYPGTIAELHYDVRDEPGQDLLSKFDEIFDFLESHRKKSERVLVFSEHGRSRAVTAVIAYLIKKNKWTLKESYDHVKNCHGHMQPLQDFLEQLSTLEQQVHGKSTTPIDGL